jgi:hypothetical protein
MLQETLASRVERLHENNIISTEVHDQLRMLIPHTRDSLRTAVDISRIVLRLEQQEIDKMLATEDETDDATPLDPWDQDYIYS